MSINYKPLFSIQTKHDFYVDGRAKGLTLLPSPTTQRQLKAHRMLFRNMPYGAVVLYRTEGAGSTTPFISLPEEMRFTFAMYTDDPGLFFNITRIDNPRKLLYFENDLENTDAVENLPVSWLDSLELPLFTASFTDPNATLAFKVLDRNEEATGFFPDVGTGTLLKETQIEPINVGEHRFEQQISLLHLREGRYQLLTNGDFEQNVYVSRDLAGEKLIGIVEMTLEDSGTAVSGKQLFLQFENLSVNWKYKIVNKTRKTPLLSNPPVIALGATANPPPIYGTPTFGAATLVINTEERVQGLETWDIVSSAPIPFYEFPLLNLELISGTSILSEHLPGASSTATLKWNASEERYESEIYVFV